MLLLRRFDRLSKYGAYSEDVAQHEARVFEISEHEWEIVCPSCPGDSVRVSGVKDSPMLATEEHAAQLARFHQEIYSDLGHRILRAVGVIQP